MAWDLPNTQLAKEFDSTVNQYINWFEQQSPLRKVLIRFAISTDELITKGQLALNVGSINLRNDAPLGSYTLAIKYSPLASNSQLNNAQKCAVVDATLVKQSSSSLIDLREQIYKVSFDMYELATKKDK